VESGEFAVRDQDFAVTLYRDDWHQGVVGILASRIKERFHRPTIIFAEAGDDELKGSGRSIPGVHLRDVLDRVATQNPGLVTKFGGHAMAAGLSLAKVKLAEFREAFNQAVADELHGVTPNQEYLTDGSLSHAELSPSLAEALASGGPWGQGFEPPSFDGTFAIDDMRVVGEKHLKFRLATDVGVIDAIAFNADVDTWVQERPAAMTCVYKPSINDFRGERRLQLQLDVIWPLITT
jgi:single-stranded-DNA-specific exonuclease